MRLGDLEITPVVDGVFRAPPRFFGDMVDFTGHEDLLDADGRMHLPIGCFVVRGAGPLHDQTVLVDAGLGHVHDKWFDGGQLLDGLAAAGVGVDTIDLVVCSHLHLDHCGWIIGEEDGQPTFPNAQLWVGAGDWRSFIDERDGEMFDHIHEGLTQLAAADRVTLIDGDAPITPGVSAMAAPGHTPGHSVLVLSSGTERALLLGDAITCPAQLDHQDWAAMSDVDPALAVRTRERLWRELEADGTMGAGAHFPELQFGRVLRGNGRRWWA